MQIRTPLNGVKFGMTDLALDSEMTVEQRSWLETVKLSADALLTVITHDILDFSKIEAGKIDLEEIDFNLRDCVEEALKTFAVRADERGLELLCDVAPEVPEMVQGDSGRLQSDRSQPGGECRSSLPIKVRLPWKVEIESDEGEMRVCPLYRQRHRHRYSLRKLGPIFSPFAQAGLLHYARVRGHRLGPDTISALAGIHDGGKHMGGKRGRTRFPFLFHREIEGFGEEIRIRIHGSHRGRARLADGGGRRQSNEPADFGGDVEALGGAGKDRRRWETGFSGIGLRSPGGRAKPGDRPDRYEYAGDGRLLL